MSDDRKSFIRCLVFTALTLFWMWLIFILSAENASDSSDTSNSFAKSIMAIFSPLLHHFSYEERMNFISNSMGTIRKTAHFFIYAILGGLWFGTLSAYQTTPKKLFRAVVAFGITVLYAVSDEIHQLSVAGRSGEVRDVLIDSIAAACSIGIILLILYRRDRQKGKTEGKD